MQDTTVEERDVIAANLTDAEERPTLLHDRSRPGSAAISTLGKIHALQEELTSSPYSHDIIELALAVATSLPISKHTETALVWLLIVGAPSSDKTQSVLFLKDCPDTVYVDSLTENSFISGYVDEKRNAGDNDLLPKLRDKCLIVKDLTTLFSVREDKVRRILGDMQSIYDGDFTRATGTRGLTQYESSFALLGCITPRALMTHHNYLSSIGSRFLYYRVPRLTEGERQEGFKVIWGEENRDETVEKIRSLVTTHVRNVLKLSPVLTKETREQQQYLERLSELVACGRAVPTWEKAPDGKYKMVHVQVEEPFRALLQLRNLGRALARVHGRTAITDHELELLRRVALSSLSANRVDVLALFRMHPEGFIADTCAAGIEQSKRSAEQRLAELIRDGLVISRKDESKGGRPPTLYCPAPKFADILTKPVEHLDHIADLA